MRLSERCPLCQSWNWCGRQCRNAPVAPDVANAALALANTPEPMANGKTTYRYRDPEKRKAYQRALMRKRRAAATA